MEGSKYINKSKKGFEDLATSKQRKDRICCKHRNLAELMIKEMGHQSRNSISEVIK